MVSYDMWTVHYTYISIQYSWKLEWCCFTMSFLYMATLFQALELKSYLNSHNLRLFLSALVTTALTKTAS